MRGSVARLRLSTVGLLVGLAAGCGQAAPTFSASPSAAVGSPSPSGFLPSEVTLLLTCNGAGPTFPRAALDAPPGAEARAGAEFDALRELLAELPMTTPRLPLTGWRQVARDATTVLFLAAAPGDAPPWNSATIELHDGQWRPSSSGTCDLRAVLGPGIGSATWSLDPAFAVPAPADTQIHVQVWERACASGRPATGRVVGPTVAYGTATVTVTYGVRALPGAQECPSNPPTPVLLELAEPFGNRVLLDGGMFPAAPPSAPY